MKVLVTGANGFIGQYLCTVLKEIGMEVVAVFHSRRPDQENEHINAVFEKTIDGTTNWTEELVGVDVVIHLAARAHVTNERGADDLAKYRKINVEGTRCLAQHASRSGVRRFLFLSSIKVNGERTFDEPFSASQPPNPEDSYGITKMEAEDVLKEVESVDRMEVVIIRPPLVYGPGVKGNLLALVNLVKRGVPLPFGALNNRRDLISIYNLCDLIRVCILHPAAPGNTFLVSDNEAISTRELIRYIARGLGRNARLFFIPIWVLRFVAGIFGKTGKLEKLSGNLQIDISSTQRLLDWSPPFKVAESFQKMYGKGQEL